MPRPTTLIPVTPPLSGLAMVQQLNDWLAALKTAWAGDTPPAAVEEGMVWLDTSNSPHAMRVYVSGQWLEVMHSGNSLALGTTTALARSTLDVAQRQADAGDTTDGRGMCVGAFGVGALGLQPPDNNINNIMAGGLYRITAATVGGPPGGASGDAVVAVPSFTTHQGQLYFGTRTETLWYQVKDDTFGGWAEVPHGNNIGRVIVESISVFAVGAPAFCRNVSGATIGSGSTVSGSVLRASGTDVTQAASQPLSGTWRCQSIVSAGAAGLFVRIA